VQAVIARRDAERRQKQAENLVTFMLGDLNDKLAQVQRLDIIESVDDQAMKYFASLPSTDVTDETLVQRAKALEKIGTVRLDQGRLPAAMDSYRAALPLAAALADERPANLTRQLAHARIQAFIGLAHWYQGQLDESLREFESAQSVLRRSQRLDANDPRLLSRLAEIDNNIGHILESRGQLEEAARRYRSMMVLSRRLVAAQPDNVDWTVQLGLAHNNLGKLALMRGDLAVAVAEYAADDAIESELSRRNPKDNNQLEKVAITRATLGRTVAMTGDIETGVRNLQQAIDIVMRLWAIDRSNTSFQEDLGLYAMQLSRLHRVSGNLPAAASLTAQSISVFTAMTSQDPVNTVWKRELAEAKLERAEHLRASGHAAGARMQALSALTILEPLLAQQPDDRATVLATVGTKLLLGGLADDSQAAQHARVHALELAKSTKSGKGDPRLLMLQVEALLALDRKAEAQPIIQLLSDGGCRDRGLVALLQREQIQYPGNPTFQTQLQAARRGAGDFVKPTNVVEMTEASTLSHQIANQPE
jgi:tetratricopeptide (TPR) repeat protein